MPAKTFEDAKEQFLKSFSIKDKGYKTPCWEINNPDEHRGGYGRVWFQNSGVTAHRFSWMIHFGDIPKGMEVCHKCDNPPCVNPNHLFLGTHLDNMRDAYSKNRVPILAGTMQTQAKLNDEKVRFIRQNYKKGIKTYNYFAQLFGVDQALIARVVKGTKWRHVQ
jgi:hypothetical protein